jgi:hypothetical protein
MHPSPYVAKLNNSQVATASQGGLSKVLVGTHCISACLSRCAVYELLYLASPVHLESGPALRKALVDLYRAILAFLVNAKGYLGHGTAHRAITTVSKGDEFSALLEDVQKCEQTVRLNADNADAEYMRAVGDSIGDVKNDLRNLLDSLPIPLAAIEKKIDKLAKTADETHQAVDQINANFNSLHEKLSEEELEEVIRRLSDKDVTERYRRLRDARQHGTNAWLEDVEEVKQVINRGSTESRIVWVQGRPVSVPQLIRSRRIEKDS